jgi:hypothetical protein
MRPKPGACGKLVAIGDLCDFEASRLAQKTVSMEALVR